MATACITQTAFRFHEISRPIVARFDQPHASSDGGAVLLKAVDDRLALTGGWPTPSRTGGNPARSATRSSTCCANVCSASPAGMPTATTPLA